MKILVIQLRRIGDILLTTPVLPILNEMFPQSSVDFLCEPMGISVLETNPHIHRLRIYDKKKPWKEIQQIRKEGYDIIFDFMNNPRSSLLSFLSGASDRVAFFTGPRNYLNSHRFPVPKIPEYVPLRKIRLIQEWADTKKISFPPAFSVRPQLFLKPEDESFANDWLKTERLNPKKFVILAPAHRHLIRQWRQDGFRDVGLFLFQKRGIPVYLAWGPEEKDQIKDICDATEGCLKMLPPTTMRQMGAIFQKAALVATNDSGAMHLAVSVETPTVTIYGPTRPIDWNPALSGLDAKGKDIAVSAAEVECLGCHRSECPVGHICMNNLSTEKVIQAADKILEGQKI